MAYPYEYFKTKKMISLKNINDFFTTMTTEESILKDPKLKLDIDEYIKKYKLDLEKLKNFQVLKKLSEKYDQLIKTTDKRGIELFFNYFFVLYSIISKNKNRIETFYKTYDKIKKNKNLNKIYNTKFQFPNPLNIDEINFGLNKEFFDNSIDIHKYEEPDKIKLALDILLYGNIINLSLPSPGAITFTIYDPKDPTKFSFCEFINRIINNTELGKNIVPYIPLKSLDISSILANILLDIPFNKKYNNNSFLNINNYDKMNNLIKNIIDSIEINTWDDIITIDKKEKYKKKYHNKYIIPYFQKDIKGEKKIVEITKEHIESKLKTPELILKHNYDMFQLIITDIKTDLDNMNKENYKNILASFLFITIELVYYISFKYIQLINSSIGNLLDKRKEGRFSTLNIQEAFNYTSLLMKSLLKFKLIMLNNFYDIFLPVSIGLKNYGMKLDDNGCYVPESSFLQDNSYIFNSYPFIEFDKPNSINLQKFLINMSNKNDIYDKNYILETGGKTYNNDIMNKSILILNNYYILLQQNNNFDLFIMDKLKSILKEKIPYELIPNELEQIKTVSSSSNKNKLEISLSNIFESKYEKSIIYYHKLKNIEDKLKNYKGSLLDNIYFEKNKLSLITTVYYLVAKCIELTIELNYNNTKYKNTLLKKIKEIQKKYESSILYK
jgi:hypothetical protein